MMIFPFLDGLSTDASRWFWYAWGTNAVKIPCWIWAWDLMVTFHHLHNHPIHGMALPWACHRQQTRTGTGCHVQCRSFLFWGLFRSIPPFQDSLRTFTISLAGSANVLHSQNDTKWRGVKHQSGTAESFDEAMARGTLFAPQVDNTAPPWSCYMLLLITGYACKCRLPQYSQYCSLVAGIGDTDREPGNDICVRRLVTVRIGPLS